MTATLSPGAGGMCAGTGSRSWRTPGRLGLVRSRISTYLDRVADEHVRLDRGAVPVRTLTPMSGHVSPVRVGELR